MSDLRSEEGKQRRGGCKGGTGNCTLIKYLISSINEGCSINPSSFPLGGGLGLSYRLISSTTQG